MSSSLPSAVSKDRPTSQGGAAAAPSALVSTSTEPQPDEPNAGPSARARLPLEPDHCSASRHSVEVERQAAPATPPQTPAAAPPLIGRERKQYLLEHGVTYPTSDPDLEQVYEVRRHASDELRWSVVIDQQLALRLHFFLKRTIFPADMSTSAAAATSRNPAIIGMMAVCVVLSIPLRPLGLPFADILLS